MRSAVMVVPGRLETRTGGYIYDRRMVDGLQRHSWSVDVRELDDSFPHPTPAALADASHVLASVREGTVVLVDGLALGAMPAIIEREASRLRIVALVHLPLSVDVGIDREAAARLEATERLALAAVALVIVTGAATLPLLAKYGIPRDRIVVVEPGTDRAPLARGSGTGRLQLLSVATLHPGKGHEILFRALARVPHRNWHLTCAGSTTRHPATVERLQAVSHSVGVDTRVTLVGELGVDRLAECYTEADLFVLATLQETYGMAVAEALARGLPVLSTTTGAIPDLVGDEAGVLVPPGDVEALAEALSRVMGDPVLRDRLARGARRVRDRLPDWEHAISRMAGALERVTTHG